MIIVSLKCQMGNQLFQYAFGAANAKRLHTRFIPFLNTPYYPFKLEYFKLDPFTRFVFSYPKITRQYSRVCRKLVKHMIKTKIDDNEWHLLDNIENNCYYDGFFQSERYFQPFPDTIRRRFRIKKSYRNAFENKYGELFRTHKTIVVHLRRKDYNLVGYDDIGGVNIALPLTYYQKAFEQIKQLDDYVILFISDDIESVKNDFGNHPNYRFETNPSIIDFQLIQHADIAIIANSTFAWWAAYLSHKPSAQIYAPAYWWGFKVRKEFPVGIMTAKFHQIEF
ncbi:alpha-1,2-fucosyltransferase [Microbacter margulisiae]|uniref:Glycosyl transferase family 11 n=1 Tax=Microbacter margulisiae TaxID=1350067 RepID=A0A7W5DST0_9PORP|nr:alpha-1,2-fucosyltransferase [Microbacter margulisiae]MBB3188407.1 hypothetical protein [Microbacter margulisiae]